MSPVRIALLSTYLSPFRYLKVFHAFIQGSVMAVSYPQRSSANQNKLSDNQDQATCLLSQSKLRTHKSIQYQNKSKNSDWFTKTLLLMEDLKADGHSSDKV